MKIATTAILVALALPVGSQSLAKDQPQGGAQSGAAMLQTTLDSMIQQAGMPPGQSKRPVDPDQGDDNASLVAITKVCSSSTPAAQRSAICPTPVSPD